MKYYLLILLFAFSYSTYGQNKSEYLSENAIEKDLAYLNEILQSKSSYQGLNGYDYRKDFDSYLKLTSGKQVTKYDFGLFLAKTIGKIGDRHSFIKEYEIKDSLYLPFAFAPYKGKVLVVNQIANKTEFDLWDPKFPYLKSIHNIPIEKILSQILPGEVLAPKNAYQTNAVRGLRDIESVFRNLKVELPNPVLLIVTNDQGIDKEVKVNLVTKKARLWDERFYNGAFGLKEEQYNDKTILNKFFKMENNIGYIQIGDMLEKENTPGFFEYLNNYMLSAKQSKALIIDLRDNGGGTRDIVQELAGYFIHPDSVYVVNITQQRGKLPLDEEAKEGLNSRFLFSKNALDRREQATVGRFTSSFKPMYDLDKTRFSEYYYHVLNGQKITKGKYHYNKPVYILANERTFSAASILVSVFKDLPNIKIVGVNTDGSSGNSERFELPNSKLRGKISTMVSYQKNGKILDGIGTEPDILIERNMDQIFMKEDFQLKTVLEIIKQKYN
jgi:C-terminal processing protease CtpA/Prc